MHQRIKTRANVNVMRTHWSWELTEGLGGAGPESEGREGGNLIHCHRDGDDAPVFGV